MYNRILVPLDGSKLAECALPYVEDLAKGYGAQEVILVSVTEQVRAHTHAPEAGELSGKRFLANLPVSNTPSCLYSLVKV